MKKFLYLFVSTLFIVPVSAQWQSSLVNITDNGKITYNKDADGFVIPDFSNAGYKNGLAIPSVDLPERTIVVTPLPGVDNTERIQTAIDEAGSCSLDDNGFRGVVFLMPGKYIVDGTISIGYDGVILRGSGCDDDTLTSTLLYCDDAVDQERTIVHMGSPEGNRWGSGNGTNKTNLKTAKVMPGDYSFEVEDASGYAVGDLICLKYPTTDEWLTAVNNGGNTGNYASYWSDGTIDISYHRYITNIEGNTITIDAPVFYCLDQKYAVPYIYHIPDEGTNYKILQNVGIENLRIEFARTPATSTSTVDQNCLLMCSLENSWAKNLYLTGFIHAGIKTFAVTRSTIEDCQSMNPSGYRTGANHYNFESYQRSQLILYKNCKTSKGRHHYIANGGASASGIVVLNMASTDDGKDGIAEGHRLWSQGILFDGWKERTASGLKVYNRYKLGMYLRKNEGSGHGYGGTNSVFWNCDVQEGGIYLDKVPTGQNYAIGCIAKDIKKHDSDSYGTGYIEGQNTPGLYPASLYEAQLAYRLTGSVHTGINQPVENSDSELNIVKLNNEIIFSPDKAGVFSIYTITGQTIRSTYVTPNNNFNIKLNSNQIYIISFQSSDMVCRKKFFM
ncbi:MAG: hypothetical protein PHH37_06515 [Paludibacter sp.]|nr:hypothetical protein [Paludibacter sp.]